MINSRIACYIPLISILTRSYNRVHLGLGSQLGLSGGRLLGRGARGGRLRRGGRRGSLRLARGRGRTRHYVALFAVARAAHIDDAGTVEQRGHALGGQRAL